MAPEFRAEWQNFVNSNDIQPLGNAYGYQMELPLEGRARIDRFFDDPRNLRGLLGEITTDPSGNPRAAALRTKETLQQNPQFLRDVDLFVENRPRQTASGLQDAYAIRQLFGESPLVYGSTSNDASTEPRGTQIARTGERVRVDERGRRIQPYIPTNELSPSERTRLTSSSLRPQVFNEDLNLLGDPELMRQAGVAPNSNLDRARRFLSSTIGADIDTAYNPVSLNATENVDDEGLRRLVTRDNFGSLTIGGDFPGQFVFDLQRLLNQPEVDQNYILEQLQTEGELPYEASRPSVDFEDYDFDADEPEPLRSIRPNDLNRITAKYPELKQIQEGPSARGSRLPRTELETVYQNYIPENYQKLPKQEIQNLKNFLFAGQNPQATDLFYQSRLNSILGGSIKSKLEKLRDNASSISDPDERTRVSSYFDDYLKNLESKLKPVSSRLAGIGGGEYLTERDIAETYPGAYEKLETFNSSPYVPDYFEPRVSQTIYSESGRPYKVDINRSDSSLRVNDMSSNFLEMIQNKPYAGIYDIDFTVNDQYQMSDSNLPPEVRTQIRDFVKTNAFRGLPSGAVVRNSPLLNETIRKSSGSQNKRSAAYQQSGFGGLTERGQFAYIDPDTGSTVPIQPYSQSPNLRGDDFFRAYYSIDPINAALKGGIELGQAIKATPSSLLPGAADLIPSPEAIRTGYEKGPVEMGKQMGQEFLQGLPVSAAAAGVLATPALAPLAPGIGAGLVGVAGGRALNEVVRQQTGEGIVSKLRQALGTESRTGRANKPQPARPYVQPQIVPTRQVNPVVRELQNRVGLAGQRFNPAKGEFGLSELLFGR